MPSARCVPPTQWRAWSSGSPPASPRSSCSASSASSSARPRASRRSSCCCCSGCWSARSSAGWTRTRSSATPCSRWCRWPSGCCCSRSRSSSTSRGCTAERDGRCSGWSRRARSSPASAPRCSPAGCSTCPLGRAAVIGAILIVSGPTVVGPLLAVIRPKQPLESVLAFEGIFIDPIGATVALGMVNLALHKSGPRLGTDGAGRHPHRAGRRRGCTSCSSGSARVPAGHARRARGRRRAHGVRGRRGRRRGVRALGDDGPGGRPGQPAVGAAGGAARVRQPRRHAPDRLAVHRAVGPDRPRRARPVPARDARPRAPASWSCDRPLAAGSPRAAPCCPAGSGRWSAGWRRAASSRRRPRACSRCSSRTPASRSRRSCPIVFGVVLATAIVYGRTGPLVAGLLGVRADRAGAHRRRRSASVKSPTDRDHPEMWMLLTGKTLVMPDTSVCYP